MTSNSASPVSWVNVTITCPIEDIDDNITTFEQLGAKATSVVDIQYHHTPPLATVHALFEKDFYTTQEIAGQLPRVLGIPDHSGKTLEDRDWVRESQSKFSPIDVAHRVRIIAPWHKTAKDDLATVVINPGTAFGTGHHATTRLCLKFLTQLDLTKSKVIDYGCGSGVIALTAIALGAQFAWGVDNDSEALTQSHENAKRNGFETKFQELSPDKAETEKLSADVVVANIHSEVLCELSNKLTNMVKPNGWLAISGILDSQVDRVTSVYQKHIKLTVDYASEWALLSGQRR